MKKYTWIFLTVLLAALIGGASVLYNRLGSAYEAQQLATQVSPTEEPGGTEATAHRNPAPDFTAVDGNGNEVKLSDFFGKPVVLNFWASWCGPCKSEMPDFEAAYLAMGEDVQFLMVNMTDGYQETVDQAKAFLERAGYTFPVYYDVNSEAAIAYGVSSIPTTYFIDAEGNLVAYGRGAISAENLQQGIDMILP